MTRRDVEAPVSLLDLLPTLVDIAGGDPGDIVAGDGMSLWPASRGAEQPERLVAAEFLAEGVSEPVFMLRDGRFKFIASEGDPPVLFDLTEDPRELVDLVQSGSAEDRLAAFEREARARWDAAGIKAAVIADQRNRRLVMEADGHGLRPDWDYQPVTDASRHWVRAGAWTTTVEAKAHLPLREPGR